MSRVKIKILDNMSLESVIDGDAELIPLMSEEDEAIMNKEELPKVLPILPLRNTVLFPGVVIPITAGRDSSIKLIIDANKGDKTIGVVSQKNEEVENPTIDDIHKIGTVAKILKMLKMPDGNTMVVIQGQKRFEIDAFVQDKPYIKATTKIFDEVRYTHEKEFNEIIDQIRELSIRIIDENPQIPSEASGAIKNIKSNAFLIDFVSSNMHLEVEEKQELLNITDQKERALATLKKMTKELQRLELRNDIQSKVREDMDKQQRDYFLNQQMKTIQEELGGVSYDEEIDEMKEKAKKKKWSKEIAEIFDKEIGRLQRMNPQVAEYSVQRNYLDLFLDLPWNEFTEDNFDLKRANEILNRDHFGLEKVKKRIIEYLAVLKLKKDMKSPILCLYGPPGTGKTSLGKSIAEAVGRKYVRLSLGGLRDESEIRGHRKTYIGAMPGRIIKSIQKAKTSNPLIVLDEIDKLASNTHNGSPSSAMLEVLDPEQNSTFHDNFLDVDYDLSRVLFIATANSLSTIPWALRDRMEIINVSGYTVEEKVEIAKQHLLPKQIEAHGIKKKDLKLSNKVLEKIITGYTRESGVRGLDKMLAKMARYIAKSIVMEEKFNPKVTEEELYDILGVARMERNKYENNEVAGVVTGLAWTQVGGDILFIESVLSKGKGLTLTGNMGKVMKESATIAMEYIKANYDDFGIKQKLLQDNKIHIHIPEGATPKDGPSAGIAMLTSLVSTFTQRKIKANIAMTGEITLRGKVLPVGGLKEKILAAKRANIKEIILCAENKKDIDEITQKYIKGLKFHYVTEMSEVIKIALLKQKVKGAKKV